MKSTPSNTAHSPGKVVVIGTGGTIAGLQKVGSSSGSGYDAAQISTQDLLRPLLNQSRESSHQEHHDVIHLDIDPSKVKIHDLFRIDSKDITTDHWRLLVETVRHEVAQTDVRSVIITHGTDTMEETALILKCLVDTAKPIILTGAMLPADDRHSDGLVNLRDAFVVAQASKASGVMVVLGGLIHDAAHVRKLHPTEVTGAFGSGCAQPIGVLAGESGSRVVRWHKTPLDGLATIPRLTHLSIESLAQPWPWVEILHSHGGSSADLMGLLCQQGVQGIVIAGTGNGTIHVRLEEGLKKAREQGVAIRKTTQLRQASIGGEIIDNDAEALALTAPQARVLLQLQLLATQN